ncbi:unnamed protein product [Protopolystoma xenopodis]|uniref:Uncharacterized protein n=1 Tax=Protopolystoma xenopodis TaxID=117903 RepID=A0A3S4ZIN3_9PLAT|nr:unnamed protein product [Protopolystoma xenopodis]
MLAKVTSLAQNEENLHRVMEENRRLQRTVEEVSNQLRRIQAESVAEADKQARLDRDRDDEIRRLQSQQVRLQEELERKRSTEGDTRKLATTVSFAMAFELLSSDSCH